MIRSALLFILIVTACGPENEKLPITQVPITQPAKTLDTLANPEKDGLQAELPETLLPFTPEVIELLNQAYPGWQQPHLPADTLKQDEVSGPLIVKGDFNKDKVQDMALQLVANNRLVIVALLSDQTIKKQFILQELTSSAQPAGDTSAYELELIQEGTELKNADNEATHILLHDAIGIKKEGKLMVYFWEDGKLKSIAWQPE